MKNDVIARFDNFDFSSAMSRIMTFMSTDLSSFYLDIAKDILYCNAKDSLRRKQVQNVIYKVSSELMRMLTPVLPFTMEEVHNNMPDYNGKSAALLDYPEVSHEFDKSVLADYKSFMNLRDEVNKAIEEVRASGVIGSSQEALLVLPKSGLLVKLGLDKKEDELARLFIVSKAIIGDKLEVKHIDAQKCPRCWNYVEKLYPVDDETCVCERCKGVLGK